MFFFKSKKKSKYSDLSISKKVKIIKRSANEANKEQLGLVDKYDKKSKDLKLNHAH